MNLLNKILLFVSGSLTSILVYHLIRSKYRKQSYIQCVYFDVPVLDITDISVNTILPYIYALNESDTVEIVYHKYMSTYACKLVFGKNDHVEISYQFEVKDNIPDFEFIFRKLKILEYMESEHSIYHTYHKYRIVH